MFGNIDPAKMLSVQQVSSKVNAEIRVLHESHEIHLRLTPTDPRSTEFVENFLPQFASGMAQQLAAFFAIKGEIINVGKK